MRLELLWNLRLLCERLAVESQRRRRLARLRHTPADGLALGHLDSLELIEIAARLGIKVIYDVGANVGTWTLLAKSLIPNANVEAFEPLAVHRESFRRNCSELRGVTLHPVALGSENTTKPLHVTDFSDASSFLHLAKAGRDLFGLAEVAQVPASLRRLDDYRGENRLESPDLIKLDVQGFELEVLRGASGALANAKALIVEVGFVPLYQDQCTFAEVCTLLEHHKFAIHALSAATTLGKPLIQTDVLFLRQA